MALPCVVPKEWIAPPDAETADGELMEESDDEDDDERAAILRTKQRRSSSEREQAVAAGEQERWSEEMHRIGVSSGSRDGSLDQAQPLPPQNKLTKPRDTSGRPLPISERAPV